MCSSDLLGSTGLNQALRELSDDVDVETDTTRGSRTRTKLNYRVRRNLRIQLGYAGAATQRERDTTYLSVDWQFIPKWSVVATGGDKGTSILDVLYRHRY